jgi:hypothetical protein
MVACRFIVCYPFEVGGIVLHVGDLDAELLAIDLQDGDVPCRQGFRWLALFGLPRLLTPSTGFARSAARAVATTFFFRSTMPTGAAASRPDYVGLT